MLVVLLLSEQLDTSRHQEPLMRTETCALAGHSCSARCMGLSMKDAKGHAADEDRVASATAELLWK